MQRLLLGVVALVATLLTGILAGGTEQPPARIPIVVRQTPATSSGLEAVASVQASPEESPEDSEDVERVRLPRSPSEPVSENRPVSENQSVSENRAQEILRFEKEWKGRLHAHGLGIARVLEGDREAQRNAVTRMQELRRERADFMAALLGRDAWERMHEIEKTGGRDLDQLLHEMQERDQGESR